MIAQLRRSLYRSSASLAEDFLGALALVVLLIVGLHLPGLI